MPTAETEAPRDSCNVPEPVRRAGRLRRFLYRGRSMAPTFRPGHLLYVRPAARDIQPGDVVVLAGLDAERYLVHRVVSVSPAGLITRGDNNPVDDPPVSRDRLVGRVEMLQENGNLRQVVGGTLGLWRTRVRWGAAPSWHRVQRLLRRPYRAVRSSLGLRRLLSRAFSRRLLVVALQTPSGLLHKTVFRGRTVARWWPEQARFECRKPYDLFIPHPGDVQ